MTAVKERAGTVHLRRRPVKSVQVLQANSRDASQTCADAEAKIKRLHGGNPKRPKKPLPPTQVQAHGCEEEAV